MDGSLIPDWVNTLIQERRDSLEKTLREIISEGEGNITPGQLARECLQHTFVEIIPILEAIFRQDQEEKEDDHNARESH